ncbi:ESX secretion-associated protein EspG [Mycobacterium vicinigordonae]|uniref:ESX secretion-associated protein EspG n=1 Tax=Mycobacterium vicinigordonae TaxID=1719132 RepID=A0A7D6I524_9MYCO|nr:ESX secretion-associated protein EspG [Mycobacterium vicinigordonae]QLL05996.1 ESX secretion-associated protein EspG [Mycobacterium vicinigordonae]
MTTAMLSEFTLTEDELQVVGSRIGVQGFPSVLDVRPRYATVDALEAAFDAATSSLVSRGLIIDGVVEPDLVPVLRALRRPQRELAMRLVTPDGMARVSVVRSGSSGVLARRVGNQIRLRVAEDAPDLSWAAHSLLSALPRAEAASVSPVGAPSEVVTRKLIGTHDAAQLADRVRALGAEPRAAMLLGSALSSRMAFAEIVYYALCADQDRISRLPAAVGVFYTKRGRIVGAPSASPSGQLWTTLKPGSDHAIGQAIGQLVEISADQWEASLV